MILVVVGHGVWNSAWRLPKALIDVLCAGTDPKLH